MAIMLTNTNIDMHALRTFVHGFELGSFSRAAVAGGRSQSAVSGQLRKLETQIGERLVRRSGRGLELTEAGAVLLTYARRLLDLNDEAFASVRKSRVDGKIRLGITADFAETWLPDILRQFTEAYSRVQIEVQTDGSGRLREALTLQKLDLVLAWGDGSEIPMGEHLAGVPATWIGHPDLQLRGAAPANQTLAVVMYDAPCMFRAIGLRALEDAGVEPRIALTSSSLPGLWAALTAGIGTTVRTKIGVPSSLSILDPNTTGLPALPLVPLSIYGTGRLTEKPLAFLAELIRASASAHLSL